MKTAIVLDADEALGTQLCRALENPDLAMHQARNRDEFFERVGTGCTTHLVMVNWLLPGRSGLQLSRELADRCATPPPVLIYAASAESEDRQQALDAGAADFLALPLSRPELYTRVTGLLRRLYPSAHAIVSVVGDIELDRDTHMVTRRGRRVHLTPGEFRLLETLARKPGEVFSREELLEAVSKQSKSSLRAIDVQVARLKLALTVGGRAPPIRAVRGRGYMLT